MNKRIRLADLSKGDTVQLDGSFTCNPECQRQVKEAGDGMLFINCEEGRHYLFGQEDMDGFLSGITRSIL